MNFAEPDVVGLIQRSGITVCGCLPTDVDCIAQGCPDLLGNQISLVSDPALIGRSLSLEQQMRLGVPFLRAQVADLRARLGPAPRSLTLADLVRAARGAPGNTMFTQAQIARAIEANPAAFAARVEADPALKADLARRISMFNIPALQQPVASPFAANGGGDTGGIGGIVGTIGNVLQTILPVLQAGANAGLIRGSVGNFLNPMAAAPAPAFTPAPGQAAIPVAQPAFLGPAATMAGRLGGAAIEGGAAALGFAGVDALLGGGGNGCGGGRPPADGSALFRMNACGQSYLPGRQQVMGPNGQIYVIQSLGKATRGSKEVSAMNSLAAANGFKKPTRKGTARRRPR